MLAGDTVPTSMSSETRTAFIELAARDRPTDSCPRVSERVLMNEAVVEIDDEMEECSDQVDPLPLVNDKPPPSQIPKPSTLVTSSRG